MTPTIDDTPEATTGLDVGFYLPRIPDDELDGLSAFLDYAWYSARQFAYWLTMAVQAEQTRRLEITRGKFIEVEPLRIPSDWSDVAIVNALKTCTALSYSVNGYAAGKLIDRLVLALNALITTRLLRRKAE